MRHFETLALALFIACGGAAAQVLPADPDWRESGVPPPPAFDVKRLIPVESPPGSSLTFGIDPATLSVTPEGIVRYVVVASSRDGGQNVMYEGIRCSKAQHRVYARYSAQGGWRPERDQEWQPLLASASTRHALVFARAGLCKDNAVNRSADTIVRTLKGRQPAGYD